MSSILVAAIDFGTTFSGYAFSFVHDYKKDPLKISANTWTAGVGNLVSLKTSTCVLFDSTQTFHSFGFEAEEKYSNLALDNEHHDWYYFRRFKMMLYNKMHCCPCENRGKCKSCPCKRRGCTNCRNPCCQFKTTSTNEEPARYHPYASQSIRNSSRGNIPSRNEVLEAAASPENRQDIETLSTLRGLKRESLLEDEKGKKMEAMKVFSSVIGYLKDHMWTSCEKQLSGIQDSDITWVLTVPAIWNDSSKQFMREAAEKVGIRADKLMIALEPEAASLYCMHQPIQKDTDNSTFGVFKSGAKYMVVDAGGGTIDITVHEVQENGTLKELHKANGGDWGGTKVDESFKSLLADIVGNDVMGAFGSNHKYDFLEFLTDFEVKKRTIYPNLAEKVTFKVPISLLETYRETNPGSNIKTAITSKPKYENKLTWTGDKLRMDAELTKALFGESCKKIVDHLKQLFRHSAVKDVQSILLVGGFAESPMLQVAIKEAFKDKKVIVPQDAGLAVLKGAVLYGHEPKTISARVCKYTYGVDTSRKFDSTIHPKSKKFIRRNGEERCNDIFSIHVRVGQLVKVGEPQVNKKYTVGEPDQTRLTFYIYTSNNKEPTYTTDEGCIRLGQLSLDLPDTSKGKNRGANVSMTFSGTEIVVTAVDQDDPKKVVSTTVDFLG